MISAKIITHSIANNIELITAEWCYPRFIHSEVMTHRMFSRNASSSRAIPVQKMVVQVLDNPALPVSWGENKPGMQAGIQLDPWGVSTCKNIWNNASLNAVRSAKHLADQGLHKQVVNRLLEPFQWIKVIVTATEWDNFFVLRLPYEELNSRQRAIADSWKIKFKNNPDGKDAQPEIQDLARCMKKAIQLSKPTPLEPGEWHLPYVDREKLDGFLFKSKEEMINTRIKCSVARCARVSYNNHDNSSPDIEKDIALADRLLAAGHMSPFEHQATPMGDTKVGFWCDHQNGRRFEEGVTHIDIKENYWSGNFKGWIQYRQLLTN